MIGLLWNRLDVGIFGYFRDAGTIYLPSVIEWALSLGVIAAAALAFLYAVENLPIFDAELAAAPREPGPLRAGVRPGIPRLADRTGTRAGPGLADRDRSRSPSVGS